MQTVSRKRARRAGFSLVDVSIATLVMALGMGTLVGSVFASMRREQENEETAAASQVLRALLERLNAMELGELYATYNSDPLDDTPRSEEHRQALVVDHPLLCAGGKPPVVEILLPCEGGMLREDGVAPELGLPRDLDGDGRVDAEDHARDLRLLPVAVRLAWDTGSGPHVLEMATLLGRP
jgi:hypothetical protein